MRKLLFTVLTGCALLAMAPAAFARHHHHPPRPHHTRVRHERFKADGASTGAASTSGVGTVTSFSNGVLTITLADGSTVSGEVTDRTGLECMTGEDGATPQAMSHDGSGGGDNTSDGADNTTNGGDNTSDAAVNTTSGGEDSSDGADNPTSGGVDPTSGGDDTTNGSDGDQNETPTCTTAALVPGAVVGEADLTISSAGAIWSRVELAS
jgi:hypothetical protein